LVFDLVLMSSWRKVFREDGAWIFGAQECVIIGWPQVYPLSFRLLSFIELWWDARHGIAFIILAWLWLVRLGISSGSDMDGQKFHFLVPSGNDLHGSICSWSGCCCWRFQLSDLTSESAAQSKSSSTQSNFRFFGVNSLILDSSPGHCTLQAMS
jgi:hypothetical protein